LPDNVGRIKDEACSIVANVDLMGYWGGIGGQLCPNFQRLFQECREGVAAAIGSGIDCKHHAMATVAGRSVRILLTMYPNGFRLKKKRSEKGNFLPIMWGI
jgi:hypothetical protein